MTANVRLNWFKLRRTSSDDQLNSLAWLKMWIHWLSSQVNQALKQLGHFTQQPSLEAAVTLFPLPSISSPTLLTKAKAAFSFAIHSSLQQDVNPPQSGNSEFTKSQAIPTLVTQLLVGCRRKVVLYSWKDGEPQEVKVCFSNSASVHC